LKPSDYIALVLLVSFGLWYAVFPNNVIRFYARFPKWKKVKVSEPKPLAVRIIGVAWIAFMLGVFFFAAK